MEIEIWSDFGCPYCCIAENRLKKALGALHAETLFTLSFRSFELDPGHGAPRPIVESYMEKYNLTEERARNFMAKLTKTASAEGIEFKYAQAIAANTFDAHRLVKFSRAAGKTEMTDRLFAAYFRDGLDLSDHGVLKRLAVEAGLDAARTAEMLASESFADAVRADEQEAGRLGIHAVPYFLVARKYAFSGAQPQESFEEALGQIMENEDLSAEEKPAGAVCGPEGCIFR